MPRNHSLTNTDQSGLPTLTPSLVNALFSITDAVGSVVSRKSSIAQNETYDAIDHDDLAPPQIATSTAQALGSSVLVRTPSRLTPVTQLKAGDFVCTAKLGFQKVIQVRELLAWMKEDSALVRITAGALGNPSTAWVTGDQKLIFSHPRFADLFGAPDVAIKAVDLVNGGSIVVEELGLPLHVFEVCVEQSSALVSDGLHFSVPGRAGGHFRWPVLTGRQVPLALRVLGFDKTPAN